VIFPVVALIAMTILSACQHSENSDMESSEYLFLQNPFGEFSVITREY